MNQNNLSEILQQNRQQHDINDKTIVDIKKLQKCVNLIIESLEGDKAENIVVIDLVGKASFADRMVIATGMVDRQIMAMAEHLDKILYEQGIRKIAIEKSSDWVLLDTGDIIVHLFRAEAREYYNIERIWGVEIPEFSEPDQV
ncbi:ribosome silencing factor [Commensalibacter sp. M0402]|uniref:ribosome silencing factor n=1 Tax=Commensalibacter TaxID=1079922 RepID=UPI0018DB9F2B|nr:MULTISPECIES: ribosome silencing factor [Commensalibacter]MBI0083764.1 ribosome silencing factor [Commensalibacter sp. W6292M3]MBI0089000.1 ribosome silencing factor [Commensalibacter melissae]